MASGPKKLLKPALKIPSSHNSRKSSISSKALKFDEKNIDETFHPDNKEYGFMKIPEIKTPFPHMEAPVNASVLRQRLLQVMSKKKRTSIIEFPSDEDFQTLGDESSSTNSYISPGRKTFEEKRKKFYASEYTLAQQRPLSNEWHPRARNFSNVSYCCSDLTDSTSHRFSITSRGTNYSRKSDNVSLHNKT